MAGELLRPSVKVLQKARTTSPSITKPRLVPCIVGPAFEVINLLTGDGALNPKAKWGQYSQLPQVIAQSEFPNPRNNLDELDIQEGTIRPFIQYGGKVRELLMGPGEAFLASIDTSSKPGFKSTGASTFDLKDKTFIFALDLANPKDLDEYITVTFSADGMTPAKVVDEINAAAGKKAASVVDTNKVLLASTGFGAKASVTISGAGSANSVLGLGYVSSANKWERIEGSGLRVKDDGDNDLLSPWLEFYVGDYKNGTSAAGLASTTFDSKAFLFNTVTGVGANAKPSAITFDDSGIPLKVGDYLYVDGKLAGGGEVMKVETTRFKIGTINTALSTVDANGRYTSKSYSEVEFSIPTAPSPFSPVRAWFKAANLTKDDLSPTTAKVDGSIAATAATAASVQGADIADVASRALGGLTIEGSLTEDGVESDFTFTFTGGPYANVDDVISAISIHGVTVSKTTPSGGNTKLVFTTAKKGALQGITIKATGTANTLLGYSTSSDASDTGSDLEFATLSGSALKFKLNKRPFTYQVVFTSNSLVDAIATINETVGAEVASIVDDDKIRLTTTLPGLGGSVEVVSATADVILGLATGTVYGSGRPYPDAYLDEDNSLVLGPEILRDFVTGYPVSEGATVYVQFKALRKDVSPLANEAGVIRVATQTALDTILGPLTTDNPLGLGLFLAMSAAPGNEMKALGVDEVTASAPYGTTDAYTRAAAMLEAEEVYAIAPLTQADSVHSLFTTHVDYMSEGDQGGERMVIISKVQPTEAKATVAASGTQGGSTATNDQFLLDVNPSPGLVEAGLNPSLPLTVEDGVYVEFEVDGELRRYNVKTVSGSLLSLNRTFATGENTDGFYSGTELTEDVVNAAWSLKVRGSKLLVPGTTRTDYSKVAETVAAINAEISNHRVVSVFPDTVTVPVDNVDQSVPAFYACAVLAGMVAGQKPQQGFTNFVIPGLTGVKSTGPGDKKFNKRMLDLMAGGGTFILIQEEEGGAVTCRQQVTTDTSTIEKREWSIIRCVDYSAKAIRQNIRKFIGTNDIDTGLINTLGATLQGVLAQLVTDGVLKGASINNVAQDSENPDTILIDVTLKVPYPCNYIQVVLTV